ncbi:MAG: hypothetical protein IJ575_11620 [Selenomonadaceae bacterium]|nr:hypothetical protein [Selenomonadaceae bacterium]
MKNLLSIVAFLICILNLNSASAGYPDYLGGDRNLILCGGHMGVGAYLDKTSMVIQKDEPSVKIIAVNVAYVSDAHLGNTEIKNLATEIYMYQLDANKVYRYLEHNGSWGYIQPVGSSAATGHYFAYEMAYYIAFNEKFYGGKKYWSDSDKKYMTPNFGSDLYSRVDYSF